MPNKRGTIRTALRAAGLSWKYILFRLLQYAVAISVTYILLYVLRGTSAGLQAAFLGVLYITVWNTAGVIGETNRYEEDPDHGYFAHNYHYSTRFDGYPKNVSNTDMTSEEEGPYAGGK